MLTAALSPVKVNELLWEKKKKTLKLPFKLRPVKNITNFIKSAIIVQRPFQLEPYIFVPK